MPRPINTSTRVGQLRALLRMAVLQNIPVAMNRSSADFIFSSPLLQEAYTPMTYDYAERLQRKRRVRGRRVDDHLAHGQGQRGVGADADGLVVVRVDRRRTVVGGDGDDFAAVVPRLDHIVVPMDVRVDGVRVPDEGQLGMEPVVHRRDGVEDSPGDVLAGVEGIKAVEEVHAHRFGPYLLINLTICIDGSLTVTRGDQIASEVEQILYDNINYLRRVHVHYHPGSPCES